MEKHSLTGALDKIVLEDTRKKEIFCAVLNGGKQSGRVVRSVSKQTVVVFVAAVLCVLAAGTALAVSLGWHQQLLEYFQPTLEQINLLETANDEPEASVTAQGFTFSVKQTLADRYNIYVVYEIVGPEDFVFTDDIDTFAMFEVKGNDEKNNLESAEMGGVFSDTFLEQNSNHRVGLYKGGYTGSFQNGTAKMVFKDLWRTEKDTSTGETRTKTLVEERWEMEWEFHFQDIGKEYPVEIPLDIEGRNIEVIRIALSPLSVNLFTRGDDISGLAELVVEFQDGSRIRFDPETRSSSFMYMVVDDHPADYGTNLLCRFEKIIDPTQVKKITLNGNELKF